MLDKSFTSVLSQSRKEEIEEELQELSYTYNVQLSENTRELVDREVRNQIITHSKLGTERAWARDLSGMLSSLHLI